MTCFCPIYTERLLGHTMKFTSFSISGAWLTKVATRIVLLFVKSATFVRYYSELSTCCEPVESRCKEGSLLGY